MTKNQLPNRIRKTLLTWLKTRLDEAEYQWIASTSDELMDAPKEWQIFTSFSGVPRHTGKVPLNLSKEELTEAASIRNGWNPEGWTVDQIGRIILLLSFAEQPKDEFLDKIEKLFVSSDWGEAEVLYKALPLYPYPEAFKAQTAEGVRSNITPVFNSIALNNPYPAEYLDEGAWNQVVLKATFVGSPIYKIIGIDDRANPTLAKILVEYAHERWSAGRPVSPELWRPVGPFLSDEYETEIERVFQHPDNIQKQAASLALLSSDFEGKTRLLEKYRAHVESVQQNGITWEQIGQRWEAAKVV